MLLDANAYRSAIRRSYAAQEPTLAPLLRAHVPERFQAWLDERVEHVGELAATRWADLADSANRHVPELSTHTPWGDRQDQVRVHPDYDQLAREAYEAGVVWPRFQGVLGDEKAPWVAVFGIGYLFSQAEQGMFCPVCLTAGTAWLLERFAEPALRDAYLPRVASREYENLFEGAMFLTERAGGSDVGANTTEARFEDGEWRLYGDKWFASNAGRARAMMVLARPQGAPAGTRGLGLFLVPAEKPDGSPNALRIQRLKDKLGTRSMPSGELTFEGAVAYPVGPLEKGFAAMAEMLSLSRLYNAVASVGNMRRVLNEAIAYTHARAAFGQAVDRYPMMRAQLIAQSVEHEADLRAVFEVLAALDRLERGGASPRDGGLVRVLTPILKYHTGRVAVDMASWAAEAFGGNGYIEDWPIARFLRDAQVLPIWEGTTNILLLDVLRAFGKEQAGAALLGELGARLDAAFPAEFAPWRARLASEAADLEAHLKALLALDDAARTLHVKGWCDRALRAFQGVLLLEAAANDHREGRGRGTLVCDAFLRRHYTSPQWRDQLASGPSEVGFEAIVRHEALGAEEAIALLRERLAAGTF